MILEVADLRIQEGRQAEFDVAIARGLREAISRAEGYIDSRVHRGIESPDRYLLMIRWRSLEDHTVRFRGGPLFVQWRSIVGPYFASPPNVEHFELPDAE